MGDLNQRIDKHSNVKSRNSITDVFNDVKTVVLTKSYRSTGNITNFTKDILETHEPIEAVDRIGDNPTIHIVNNNLEERISTKINEMKDKGYKSIAIICKNKEEIEDFLNYTNKVICKSMKYAFFVANATKLGALKLQGNIISNNIEYVISKSEFLNGGCSIFICSCGLENGVCLWRGEYDSRVYFWQ